MNPLPIILVAAVPCVVAATIMFVARALGFTSRSAGTASVGAALVIGQMTLTAPAGVSSAFVRLVHPHEAIDWLPWLVIVAVGISIAAEHIPHLTAWRHATLVLIFAAAATARLLAGSVHVTSRFSEIEKVLVLVLWSAGFTLLYWLMETGRSSGQPLLRSGMLIATTLGLALAVALPSTFLYGGSYLIVAGAIAGTVLGTAAAGSASSNQTEKWFELSDAVVPLATFLGGMLLLGHYYAGLSLVDTLLGALAIAAAVGPLPTSWPARSFLRVALCLIPLGIAVALAVAAATANPYS